MTYRALEHERKQKYLFKSWGRNLTSVCDINKCTLSLEYNPYRHQNYVSKIDDESTVLLEWNTLATILLVKKKLSQQGLLEWQFDGLILLYIPDFISQSILFISNQVFNVTTGSFRGYWLSYALVDPGQKKIQRWDFQAESKFYRETEFTTELFEIRVNETKTLRVLADESLSLAAKCKGAWIIFPKCFKCFVERGFKNWPL